jgi:hypothetical protein
MSAKPFLDLDSSRKSLTVREMKIRPSALLGKQRAPSARAWLLRSSLRQHGLGLTKQHPVALEHRIHLGKDRLRVLEVALHGSDRLALCSRLCHQV